MSDRFHHGVQTRESQDGLRPVQSLKSSTIFICGTAPNATGLEDNKPILIKGPRDAVKLGDKGTLKEDYMRAYKEGASEVIVSKVPENSDPVKTLSNIKGDAGKQTGIWAAMRAEAQTGSKPRLLCAPGFAKDQPGNATNPIISEMQAIADKLRAVAIVEGPNTTEADALKVKNKYAGARLYCVDPYGLEIVNGKPVAHSLAASVAGAFARRDAEVGYWASPSNQVLKSVSNMARDIEFAINDPATEANRLNEARIATVIQYQGWRLWGNRSLSSDPLWTFINVRRTHDLIYDAIDNWALWAMDRPFSSTLIANISDGLEAYLATLKAKGAILGYKVWLDTELNTPTELSNGKLYVHFDMEVPAPVENLIFTCFRNGTYYEAELAKAA